MPSKSFTLNFMEVPIGKFVVMDDGILEYTPKFENEHRFPARIFYPVGLYPHNPRKFSIKDTVDYLRNYKPTPEDTHRWMSERIFPPTRQGAGRMLNSIGIDEYDLWELIVRTKATSLNDYYWLSVSNQDKYADVHPRSNENNKWLLSHGDGIVMRNLLKCRYGSRVTKTNDPKKRNNELIVRDTMVDLCIYLRH